MSKRRRGGASGSRSERWTALLVAARDGDAAAFDELHREAQPPLWRRAHQRLNDVALADDVVSQTFQRVWEHRAGYDPEQSNASTWLYRILDQRIIDALKKARGGRSEALGFTGLVAGAGEDGGDGDVYLEPADEGELPQGEEVDLLWADAQVREAMARLAPADRRVLELFHFEDRNYKQIAEAMGLASDKAVGPRLTRARQRLLPLLPPEALG
jgi:RNA polymerase sigma-70 factor (ECF subfamily)